jgi:hypothetical protein
VSGRLDEESLLKQIVAAIEKAKAIAEERDS